MRFLLREDLESDLRDKNSQVKEIIDLVANELPEFTKEDELNGTSFNLKREVEGTVQLGQFYLDTESSSYSSYLTEDDGDGEVMSIQQSGKLEIEEVTDALAEYKKFL